MKNLFIGAICALFAQLSAAQASSIDLAMTLPFDGGVMEEIPIGLDLSVILDAGDADFSVFSIDIDFDDGQPLTVFFPTDPLQRHFDFTRTYSDVNYYVIIATIHGYFSFPNGESWISDEAYRQIRITTAVTPIPAALPLFASALGGLALMGWRRRQVGRIQPCEDRGQL